jgi:transcriptional regulator with XRE-family HTH domain
LRKSNKVYVEKERKMNKKHGWFDSTALYEALDAERRARNLNWKAVADQSGVSASTLTRMAQGKRPDVDGLAALTTWSGLRADDFIRSDNEAPEAQPLAMVSTYLRADKTLTDKDADALQAVIQAAYNHLINRD